MIKNVQQAIQKAQAALEHMKGCFSRLQTDIELIKSKLEKMDSYIIDEDAERREKSIQQLDSARWTWVLVRNLAKGFQAKGLLVEANINQPDPRLDDVVQFIVKGATFGDRKVTAESGVLFNDGADMLIDSSKMPFIDPWKGVTKTLTMLLQYGKEQRLFVCTERSGEHKFKQGPIDKSKDAKSTMDTVNPRPKPNDAKLQILAIVWGKTVLTSDGAYNYAYECMKNNKPIEWNNTRFGDGWEGMAKTGVIYYSAGGQDVRLTTGRENGTSSF